MPKFIENICPIVVIKSLHYLLETSDMYQLRNIHIDENYINNSFRNTYMAEKEISSGGSQT